MKPTVMPATGPTGSSILLSFRSSGKRHLLLTGGRGSGKTTLLRALFPESPGLTTWAEPGRAVWLRENGTENQCKIGVYREDPRKTGNKMVVLPDGFQNLGIPALERCAASKGEFVTIDEIGYLESGCPAYEDAIRRLMKKKSLAAVVRKEDRPFLRELLSREDVFAVDLDAPFGNNGCVILASGLGRRFGSNKLMADFCGEPMLCRALAATAGIFPRRVVVTRHKTVADLCRSRGVETVLHDLPGRNDTVRLGLTALGNVDGCLFCPGDQPLLTHDTVAALILLAQDRREAIVRPSCGGIPGAPVLFPRWTFPELLTLPPGKGGGSLIQKYPDRLRSLRIQNPAELRDVDTPADLTALGGAGHQGSPV